MDYHVAITVTTILILLSCTSGQDYRQFHNVLFTKERTVHANSVRWTIAFPTHLSPYQDAISRLCETLQEVSNSESRMRMNNVPHDDETSTAYHELLQDEDTTLSKLLDLTYALKNKMFNDL